MSQVSNPAYTQTTAANQGPLAYAEILVAAAGTITLGLGTLNGVVQYGISHSGSLVPSGSGSSFGNADVVCLAYNQNTNNLWIRTNGNAWMGGGDPVAGSNPTLSGLAAGAYLIAVNAGTGGSGSVTGRFTAAACTMGIPSGYSSWSGT